LIRTTVVGNYPKIGDEPEKQKLRRAFASLDRGEITPEQLARIQDEVTEEVIQEQIQAGVDVITDGQIRWDDGQTYIARKLKGFKITGLIRYFDTNTYYRQPVAEGPIAWTEPITLRDYQFAASKSSVPVKAVLTGPYTLARLSINAYYPSFAEFVRALAEALNQEAKVLQDAGAPIIQFDEPAITQNPVDGKLFRKAVQILTQGLDRSKVALYTYFGDVQELAPEIFQLPVGIIGLDLIEGPANEDLLSQFPSEKELALGILDARNTKMEEASALTEKIVRIYREVKPRVLYLNPNCGLEFLPRDVAYKKLVHLVGIAKRAKEALQ